MNEQERMQRNTDRLQQLYPRFGQQIKRVLQTLEASGLRPRIQDAWRSPTQQLHAFQSGFSKLKYGFHNVTGTGGRPEALAADLLDDDSPLKPSSAFLLQLAAAAEQTGLQSGIRWGLPAALAHGIDKAIAAHDWQAPVKVGWDPTHVETRDITVAEAYSGQRPV